MLILLAILIFVYNLGAGILLFQHDQLSITAQLLYLMLFISGFGFWLRRDLEQKKMVPLYCPGLLLHAGWFVVVPYYLYKTRRYKALIPIAVFIGAFIVAQVVAVVIYLTTMR